METSTVECLGFTIAPDGPKNTSRHHLDHSISALSVECQVKKSIFRHFLSLPVRHIPHTMSALYQAVDIFAILPMTNSFPFIINNNRGLGRVLDRDELTPEFLNVAAGKLGPDKRRPLFFVGGVVE
jgi:hypothetical protein